MNLRELDSFKMADAVTFHDELNPKLWHNNNLRPEVKQQLILIAEDFLSELGIQNVDVDDITISGSNAAFSYTPHSDLDLHLLVDMSRFDEDIYKEFFNAKKALYNEAHYITIHGVPVEVYVQDSREPVVSIGEYSVMQDKWLRLPTKRRANFDQTTTKAKYNTLKDLIELALQSKNLKKVQKITNKIKQYRQAGLDKGGEFGPENLAYKALRSQGYITKLYDLRDKLHSEILTIENMYQDPVKIQEESAQEIHNYSKLDKILSKLCRMIIKGQISNNDYGMVAACVLDPDNKLVSGLNSPGEDGKRVHAERVAIEKYEAKYGSVPSGSIIITTLSPCNETDDDTADNRVGESCAAYINGKGIKKVYCGYIDPTQDNDIRKFNLIETGDNSIREECKKFADTFLKLDINEASGYIPSEKEKNDPRFKTALTVDVKSDSIKKNAKSFYWNTSRAGIPPTARPNGKF
jgi:pyrimidine deaminase RibD-like protein